MCSIKTYICNAIILLNESLRGYPFHKFLAIGLLNWLEDTVIYIFNDIELANEIRNARISISEDIHEAINKLLQIQSDRTLPLVYMPRDFCYDCCIKHLSTVYMLLLIDESSKDMALANLLEAYNEAPDSENDYIKNTIKDIINNIDTAKVNIPALLEYVEAERVKDGV